MAIHDATVEAHCYTAFEAGKRLANGALPEVVRTVKGKLERGEAQQVLIFDDHSGAQIDVDLHGPLETILKHLPSTGTGEEYEDISSSPRPGRPKLGVVSREVTLLPRHWQWLGEQTGGASVTLRKLVEEARRTDFEKNSGRRRQEACYRFMAAAAGDLPHFEDASRALFAEDMSGFDQAVETWPQDLRNYALSLLKRI